MSSYYDKYVKPGYESGGFNAPAKDVWIQQIPKLSNAQKLTEEYYFPSTNHKQAMDTEAGAIQALDQIQYGGIKLSKVAAHAFLGLSHFFRVGEETAEKLAINTDQLAQDKINRISVDSTNEAAFWLQAHPSKSWTGRIDSFIGENLVQLPFYEAIGAARIRGLAAVAPKLTEVGKVANLTKWLNTSGIGKFIANRIEQAGDAFLGTMFQGQGALNVLVNTMFAPALGSLVDKNTAIVSKSVIKAAIGKFAAMGGQPLVESVENQAVHELQERIIAKTSDGGEIRLVSTSRESGYLESSGLRVPYNTLLEQQALISRIMQTHKDIDPVHFNMVNTGKATLAQLAIQKYNRAFGELNKGEQLNVRKMFRKLTTESIDELPIHNADIAKANIDHQLNEDAKEHPKLAQRIKEAEQMSGIKVSSALQETEGEAIQKQTGIQNSQATASKVKKTQEPVRLSKETKIAREEEPRKYVQFKIDTLSYLKNYAKKFKYPNLASEIKEMDEPHEFAHALQEQMGQGYIRFETDRHALLWANQFRDQLPKPFQARLIQELHEMNPGETIKDWNTQSENLAVHMEELAHTGRLFNQGNVFRSTQVENWLDKTKWQKQLRGEVEAIELERLKKVLYRYPDIQKQAIQMTKQLQKARQVSESAGSYKWISDTIRDQKTVSDWKRLLRVGD